MFAKQAGIPGRASGDPGCLQGLTHAWTRGTPASVMLLSAKDGKRQLVYLGPQSNRFDPLARTLRTKYKNCTETVNGRRGGIVSTS